MKKTILLSMAVLLFSMTSCLKEGEQSRSGEGQMFYVSETTEGLKFAYNGDLAITSPQIKAAEADKWYVMSWLWDSKMGFEGQNILKVQTADMVKVPNGTFTVSSTPATEPLFLLKGFRPTRMLISRDFGDYLLYDVTYDKKEGEVVSLNFYSDLELPSDNSTLFTINVRLSKSGTGIGENKTVTETYAVKMNALRSKISFHDGQHSQGFDIKYVYYIKEDTPESLRLGYSMINK